MGAVVEGQGHHGLCRVDHPAGRLLLPGTLSRLPGGLPAGGSAGLRAVRLPGVPGRLAILPGRLAVPGLRRGLRRQDVRRRPFRNMEKASLFFTFCFPAINNILETSAKNKKA